MVNMEQYISRRDLICWLIKQGTKNGKLDTNRKLSLDEIMSGINGLPAVRMAEKEKLLEFGLWELTCLSDGGDMRMETAKQIADLRLESKKNKREEDGTGFCSCKCVAGNLAFRESILDAIQSLENAVSILC